MRRTLPSAVLLAFACGSAGAQTTTGGCLYATTVGDDPQPVVACPMQDPLRLATHPDVLKAMEAFGIDPSLVRFRGCSGQKFSVNATSNHGKRAYVVNYASNLQGNRHLAPVLHELAHVAQMEMVGGFEQMRAAHQEVSKRIELGADYLAGSLFATVFRHFELKEFEQNLNVHGLYLETEADAHGTPSQRNSAFRRGAFSKPDGKPIGAISIHFQREIYGHVLAN